MDGKFNLDWVYDRKSKKKFVPAHHSSHFSVTNDCGESFFLRIKRKFLHQPFQIRYKQILRKRKPVNKSKSNDNDPTNATSIPHQLSLPQLEFLNVSFFSFHFFPLISGVLNDSFNVMPFTTPTTARQAYTSQHTTTHCSSSNTSRLNTSLLSFCR